MELQTREGKLYMCVGEACIPIMVIGNSFYLQCRLASLQVASVDDVDMDRAVDAARRSDGEGAIAAASGGAATAASRDPRAETTHVVSEAWQYPEAYREAEVRGEDEPRELQVEAYEEGEPRARAVEHGPLHMNFEGVSVTVASRVVDIRARLKSLGQSILRSVYPRTKTELLARLNHFERRLAERTYSEEHQAHDPRRT